MARVNVGDMINKAGIYTNPGVVTEKKEDGTIEVDTDPMALNKYHRYMNTTGLTEAIRIHLMRFSMKSTLQKIVMWIRLTRFKIISMSSKLTPRKLK